MTFTEKIKFIFSNMYEFVKPYLKFLLSEGGPIVAAMVLELVKQTEDKNGLTGPEKRAVVFATAKSRCIALGIEVASSFLNAVIETAVIKMKDERSGGM